MTLRIGLVGHGTLGQQWARAIRALPGVALAAVVAPVTYEAAATTTDAPHSFADYQAMLEAVELDAVAIAAPTDLHYDICRAAAEAGKAIVCTTPLASTFHEAELMLHAVNRAGVPLLYIDRSVFAPLTARALDLTITGLPGEVRHIEHTLIMPPPAAGWRTDIDRAGGGALMALACGGMLASLRAAGSPPATVTGECEPSDGGEFDAAARMVIETASGARIDHSCRWSDEPPVDRFTITGDAATITVDSLAATLRVTMHRGDGTSFAGEEMDGAGAPPLMMAGMVQQWQHLGDVLAGRARLTAGIEDGMAVMELLCAAYASAGSGQPVRLPFTGGEQDDEPPACAWLSDTEFTLQA